HDDARPHDVWLAFDSVWVNRFAYVHVVLLGVLALWLMRLRRPPLPPPDPLASRVLP
ncbi:MAG: hypothetical protein IIC64_10205, partial [SAR324 cluster bacterium]|nr:hypothetical protein [SAR324 cluster bacterium]